MPKKYVKSNIFLIFPNIQHEYLICCYFATSRLVWLADRMLLMFKHNRNCHNAFDYLIRPSKKQELCHLRNSR